MGRLCAAIDCSNSDENNKRLSLGLSFHGFPVNRPDPLKAWVHAVRRVNFKPTKTTYLCSDHFTEDDFQYQPFTGQRQVKPDAVPSRFLITTNTRKQFSYDIADTQGHTGLPTQTDLTALDVRRLEEKLEHLERVNAELMKKLKPGNSSIAATATQEDHTDSDKVVTERESLPDKVLPKRESLSEVKLEPPDEEIDSQLHVHFDKDDVPSSWSQHHSFQQDSVNNEQVSLSEVKLEPLDETDSQPYVYMDRDDVPSSWSQHHSFQQGSTSKTYQQETDTATLGHSGFKIEMNEGFSDANSELNESVDSHADMTKRLPEVKTEWRDPSEDVTDRNKPKTCVESELNPKHDDISVRPVLKRKKVDPIKSDETDGTSQMASAKCSDPRSCDSNQTGKKPRSGRAKTSRPRPKKSYKCDLCDKTYTQSSHRNVHKKRVHGRKMAAIAGARAKPPYKPVKYLDCEFCDKKFAFNSILVKHLRIHTGEMPYKCDICDRVFTERSHLVTHRRIHTGEKPYKCDVCDKSFSDSSVIKKHKRIHTGEKPYKCDICDKKFTFISNLHNHKRTHTGERPYTCDVCEQKFLNKSHLTNHEKTVHGSGEKPFKCDVCGKMFSKNVGLSVHKRVHTGEKPFCCIICNKMFFDASGLRKHVFRHRRAAKQVGLQWDI